MSKAFMSPGRIIYGESALTDAISEIKSYGNKAFIVTGKNVSKLEIFNSLTNLLKNKGIDYEVFTGITGEPNDIMINNGVDAYKNSRCDFLIGMGGGSPLDSMKAIALLSSKSAKISDYMGKSINAVLPKMVAIPTTAGTGSEVTKFTVITDSENDIKMLLSGECLIPDLAIIDGSLTADSPKSVTASTGLDALTHAVEAFTSKKSQSITDALAISAVNRIFKYLPAAYQDGTNKEARQEMAYAALEAGLCINNSSVTIVHGMSRPIGALFHVPHGISNAMLLSECMKFASDGCKDKFKELAIAIGAADRKTPADEAAQRFVQALNEICNICEVPTLCGYGINKDKFCLLIDKMSDDAIASGSPSNTVKPVTKEDVKMLYNKLIRSGNGTLN